MKTSEYAVFRSDTGFYAVEMGHIMEIKNNYCASFMPFVPGYIRGLITAEGCIIPVIDFPVLAGYSGHGSGACAVIGGGSKPRFALDAGEYVTVTAEAPSEKNAAKPYCCGSFPYKGAEARIIDIRSVYRLDFFKNFREE